MTAKDYALQQIKDYYGMPIRLIKKINYKTMSKRELKPLMRAIANKYGEKVKCELLSPDGCKWETTYLEVDANFMREVENETIKNVSVLIGNDALDFANWLHACNSRPVTSKKSLSEKKWKHAKGEYTTEELYDTYNDLPF